MPGEVIATPSIVPEATEVNIRGSDPKQIDWAPEILPAVATFTLTIKFCSL